MFSTVLKQQKLPANPEFSFMTSPCDAGILAGPPLKGFISQWYILRMALCAKIVLLPVAAASARMITR